MGDKLTIGFSLEDACGNKFSQESTLEVYTDLGDTDLTVIGTQLNSFLKQCGYVRLYDNIFMESITDEEYDALTDYLKQLREEQASCTSQ